MTMIFFKRLVLLFAGLAIFARPAAADNESLASIFTNAPKGQQHSTFPRRASIIFIAFNGLSFGDLSCYGQTNFQTPNFDKVAAEGTRFTEYSAEGDDLASAQAALMAGNRAASAPGQVTVAERLRQSGYHTGLIGEWLLGEKPWTQGFDEFAGYYNEQDANNYYADFMWRYLQGTIYDPTNHTLPTVSVRETIYENSGPEKGKYIPDLLMTAAANFVRVNAPGFGNRYRPFFLLLDIPAPHSVVPGKDEYPVPTDAPFTGENWPQPAKNRAALMTRLDDDLGRLLAQLKNSGMTNNVVIFLAGATAPEKFANTNLNFLKLKGEVRGGNSPEHLRAPMIVSWPSHVPAGRVSAARWSTVDFGPTAMELAYAKPTASFAGVSMLPVLLGKAATNTFDFPERPSLPGRP